MREMFEFYFSSRIRKLWWVDTR